MFALVRDWSSRLCGSEALRQRTQNRLEAYQASRENKSKNALAFLNSAIRDRAVYVAEMTQAIQTGKQRDTPANRATVSMSLRRFDANIAMYQRQVRKLEIQISTAQRMKMVVDDVEESKLQMRMAQEFAKLRGVSKGLNADAVDQMANDVGSITDALEEANDGIRDVDNVLQDYTDRSDDVHAHALEDDQLDSEVAELFSSTADVVYATGHSSRQQTVRDPLRGAPPVPAAGTVHTHGRTPPPSDDPYIQVPVTRTTRPSRMRDLML